MPRTQLPSRIAVALQQAKVALKGDSNDAEHDALSALVELLDTPPSPIRLAITVEGGLVSSVLSDSTEPIEVLVVDYDVRDAGSRQVPQDDGSFSRGAVDRYDLESVTSSRLDELFGAFAR